MNRPPDDLPPLPILPPRALAAAALEPRQFDDGTEQPPPLPDGGGFAALLELGRRWSLTITVGLDYVRFEAWDGEERIALTLPSTHGLALVEQPMSRVAWTALWRALAQRHNRAVDLTIGLAPLPKLG